MVSTVQLLLEKGANILARDENGMYGMSDCPRSLCCFHPYRYAMRVLGFVRDCHHSDILELSLHGMVEVRPKF